MFTLFRKWRAHKNGTYQLYGCGNRYAGRPDKSGSVFINMLPNLPTSELSFRFADQSYSLAVPVADFVKQWHLQQPNAAFPYWAKLWPSAIALCEYIGSHTPIFTNKKVIELGAGLGLPSAVVATYAQQVFCTDIDAQAVAFMPQQPCLNQPNIVCKELDIFEFSGEVQQQKIDEIICADVNYTPALFTQLLSKIQYWQSLGCGITIASPQRLLANDFAQQLNLLTTIHPTYYVQQETIRIWRIQ
ncbi:MAG: hypothetical protein EAY68_03115 [Bacteroidetes bacterium]|nr:MAG: hypothetical protein EAY68_03115 [Bacteroidota bacterium]